MTMELCDGALLQVVAHKAPNEDIRVYFAPAPLYSCVVCTDVLPQFRLAVYSLRSKKKESLSSLYIIMIH